MFLIRKSESEDKKKKDPNYISKYELAKSEHKYYRYVTIERGGASYWYPYKANAINVNNIKACDQEQLYFSRDTYILNHEHDYAYTDKHKIAIVEVIFDERLASFGQLDMWYWRARPREDYCGKTLYLGRFILLDTAEYKMLREALASIQG